MSDGKSNNRPDTARKAIYLVTVASLSVPVIGVVTAPILAQALGVEGRGELAAAVAPYSLLTSVATLGLPEALTFYLAKYPRLNRRAIALTSAVTVAFGGLCLAVTIAYSDILTSENQTLRTILILATSLAIPALLTNILRGAASGLQMWRSVATEKLAGSLLKLVILASLAMADQLTVLNAVIVTCIAPVLAAIVYVPTLRRQSTPQALEPHFSASKPILKFGTQVWLGSVASMIQGRLSQLIIAPLSNLSQLGLFVVAVTISDIPLLAATAIRDVIFGISSRQADKDRITTIGRLSLLIGTAGALVLGVALSWLIPTLFGEEFYEAIAPAWILLIACAVGIPGIIAGAGLAAWDRPLARSLTVIAALMVNAVGMILLVPPLGANGAAIAGLASQVVLSVTSVYLFCRTVEVPYHSLILLKRTDLQTLKGEVSRLRKARNRSN